MAQDRRRRENQKRGVFFPPRYLRVSSGIGDDDQAGLLETTGDVVGEGTGGEATGDGLGTSVRGELEGSALAIVAGRDDDNVLRVLNSHNDAGGEDDLLPGLEDVEDVDACVPRKERRGHGGVSVLVPPSTFARIPT